MEVDATLLDNLREINRLTARLISLDAIISEAFAAKSSGGGKAAAVAVLPKLNPAPEYVASCGEKTLREYSGSPVPLKLKNGNGISFFCFHVHHNREFAVLFDPTAREVDKIIQVPAPLFLERRGGVSIFLRNSPNPGFSPDSRHAAYFRLCAIARTPGENIDPARLLHDSAVSGDEPAWGEFRKAAGKYRFKCRPVTIPFNRLQFQDFCSRRKIEGRECSRAGRGDGRACGSGSPGALGEAAHFAAGSTVGSFASG